MLEVEATGNVAVWPPEVAERCSNPTKIVCRQNISKPEPWFTVKREWEVIG